MVYSYFSFTQQLLPLRGGEKMQEPPAWFVQAVGWEVSIYSTDRYETNSTRKEEEGGTPRDRQEEEEPPEIVSYRRAPCASL